MANQDTRSGDPRSGDTRTGDTSSGPGTDPTAGGIASPADAALEHDDEGNTPAAWIASGSVILASIVGGFAVVFGWWWLGAVAVAVAAVGLLVGAALSRASGRGRGGVHGEHGVEGHGVEGHGAGPSAA